MCYAAITLSQHNCSLFQSLYMHNFTMFPGTLSYSYTNSLQKSSKFLWILLACLISACSVTPPQNKENLCELFKEKEDWYSASKQTYQKWGVPVHVQMAIMFQESSFIADAQPPSNWMGVRPSTAYGYAQALDATWEDYVTFTHNSSADRDDFADASDFIGWYCRASNSKLGLSMWDAESLYLAYHEGHGGFQRKTYLQKAWLMRTAKKVATRAGNYRAQLSHCQQQF